MTTNISNMPVNVNLIFAFHLFTENKRLMLQDETMKMYSNWTDKTLHDNNKPHF